MCGLLARWMRTNAWFCRRKDLQPVMLECSSLIELSFLRTEYSNEISSGYHTILQIALTLNLEIQKSKIPLVRSGSLKDRRKPSAASRRKSFRSSFNEDFDDSFVISEGEESWVLLLPDIVEAVHDISDMNSSLQISKELRQRWLIGCEWYWIRTCVFFFWGGGRVDYSYMCFPCLKYDVRQVGDHWLLAESVITKKLFFFVMLNTYLELCFRFCSGFSNASTAEIIGDCVA